MNYLVANYPEFKIKTGSIHNQVSLDYCYSKSISDIERGINETIKGVILSKKAICIALAMIKINKLYKQVGIRSFKEYLKAKRIYFNYHTAHEYAQIGVVILKYQAKLSDIDFQEENGFKKLLLLEYALDQHKKEKDLVFEKLKCSSFREFKNFTSGKEESARADSLNRQRKMQAISFSSLREEEECIILLPIGKEIIWFDIDLIKYFPSLDMLKRFKHHILIAAKEFFSKSFAKA